MAGIDKIREALSFGARIGDPKLMAAVYQLEPEGPEIEIDKGPKTTSRICVRCKNDFLVSNRHVEQVPEDSLFNLCSNCLDKISALPEDAPLPPEDKAFFLSLIHI